MSESTYGYLADDGERVQCHICHRWYAGLGIHLRAHKTTADEYREHFGLNRHHGLVSQQTANRYQQAALCNPAFVSQQGRLATTPAAPHHQKPREESRRALRATAWAPEARARAGLKIAAKIRARS